MNAWNIWSFDDKSSLFPNNKIIDNDIENCLRTIKLLFITKNVVRIRMFNDNAKRAEEILNKYIVLM
jgi:hypothetical protein